MEWEPCKNPSQTWKAIERLKKLITKGVCFLVRDTALIDIWKDPWILWLPNFTPTPMNTSTNQRPLVVACLINQATRT